jgi:signal transduction histidine kinase
VRAEPKGAAVHYVSPAYNDGAGYVGRKGDMDLASDGGEYRDRFPSEQPSTHERFARTVLDGLSAHIAVLDGSGVIVAVNEAWRGFARANGADPGKVSEGANYLEACDAAAGQSSEGAAAFAAGVRDVLRGRRGSFELEYPCHSREAWRWFIGRVTHFPEEGAPPRAVVAHEDVTDRRLYEEERERRRVREAAARARALERKRIGRELHDRVAHMMVVVHQSLELHQALEGRDLGRAEEKMELAKRMTEKAIGATRDLSQTLSNAESGKGLKSALSELLREIVPPKIAHELRVDGDDSLVPPLGRDHLFLAVREAVRNAVAHSGARRIGVFLTVTGERVVGVVEDDGRGFDPEKVRRAGFGGLAFMEERARLVGGTCTVRSDGREGTRVEVVVPLGVKFGDLT